MPRKVKEEDPIEELNAERSYLEDQLAELQELYEKLNTLGIRSIGDLEVKMSYLQRDIKNLV
jgi:hypothetical protein